MKMKSLCVLFDRKKVANFQLKMLMLAELRMCHAIYVFCECSLGKV